MNFKQWLINEYLALKGSYKGTIFQRLVAGQYAIMPPYQDEAVPAYRDLMRKISRQNEFLQSKFQFNPSTNDPYKSMKHLTQDIVKQKNAGIKKPIINVYSDPPESSDVTVARNDPELPGSKGHVLLSNDQNVTLRGVHDAIAHFMGQHPFSARGEYAAYAQHLKTLCNTDQIKSGGCPAAKVLFTEIIGQTSYYYVYGNYTVQKAVIMSDFDHWKIGAIDQSSGLNDFFQLTGKMLVPKPDFDYLNFQNSYPVLASEMVRQLGGNSLIPLDRLPGESS